MGAIQATLLDLGWKVPAPTVWFDPQGGRWEYDGSHLGIRELVHCLVRGIVQGLWRKASAYEHGKGLEAGVDLTVPSRVQAAMKKRGDHRGATVLQLVVAAGTWPQARLYDMGMADTDLCPRCGRDREDLLHRFWRCPCNAQMDSGNVQHTQHLCRRAVVEAGDCARMIE